MLETGIKGVQTETVVPEKTAAAVGSGLLPVYATPAMIALIEGTAAASVAPHLEEGCGTVGISLNVKHMAATPIGMEIRCETELTEVDRKRLVFSAKVYDDTGLVGEGIHERFVIDNEKFMQKAETKKKAWEESKQ